MTGVRDQIAATVHQTSRRQAMWLSRGESKVIADALLPLLRAHDAQVWDEGERAGHTNANPYRHLIRNPYRDRAEQDTPDQG